MSFTLGTEMVLLVVRSFEMKLGKAHFAIRQEKALQKILNNKVHNFISSFQESLRLEI